MKQGTQQSIRPETPVSFNRLTERLASLTVTDQTFPLCLRSWRSLTEHQKTLRKQAARYPLIIEFGELRVVLEHPDQVDRLIADLQGKLERWWLHGTENAIGARQ